MKRNNNRSSLLLRFCAGAYLLYTDFILVKSIIAGDVPGKWIFLGYFCVGVFLIFGIRLLVNTWKKYLAMSSETDSNSIAREKALNEYSASIIETTSTFTEKNKELAHLQSCVSFCVQGQRSIAKTFNRQDYALGFSRYTDACKEIFIKADNIVKKNPDLHNTVIQLLSAQLITDLRGEYEKTRSKRLLKQLMDTDKGTLTFYTIPMIRELDLSIGEELAKCICSMWNVTYPKHAFKVGYYQRILDGFKNRSILNLLGVRR